MRLRYGPNPPKEAVERLDHELGIIERMGFSAYFLIVWDFVRYAREGGDPGVGQGLGVRGDGGLCAGTQPRRPADV